MSPVSPARTRRSVRYRVISESQSAAASLEGGPEICWPSGGYLVSWAKAAAVNRTIAMNRILGILDGIVDLRGRDHRCWWSDTPPRWLRPVSRAVENARDFNGLSCDPTHGPTWIDRKSTRLSSSHLGTSYAVFCL